MSTTPSTPRLVLVTAGANLLEGLGALGRADAWVTGTGYVEDVELRVAGNDTDATTLGGRFNLLSLAGPIAGPFMVTLSRRSEAGIEVLGGELVRARSAGVTLLVQPAARATTVPAARAPAATWATTAAASAARASAESDQSDEDPTPEAGDWVEHFAFGLCEVLTAEGDRLRIRDGEGTRRVREVALSMLRVSGPTESDGKQVYKLTRRTPG